ncbi:MAG: TIGR00266 family protein [Planctomycetota bacterium]|jgi:uncharacterized protein (TIGR00266 family)|nr:TIGR00266 family protein [Planctomycetota bacterium]
MEVRLDGNPDFGQADINLSRGEMIRCESDAMTWMEGDLEVAGRLGSGLFPALARKLLGGESLFLSEYTAATDGRLTLAPSTPGTILSRNLKGETFHLTAGSFLAASKRVELKTRFGGFRALFSGEGAFFIECTGQGLLLFNAYGAVIERDIDGEFTVDTGHVVAWESTLDYTIGTLGGVKATLFSGEGLVMRFSGHGRIWLQTRHLGALANWLTPYLSR